MPKNTHTDFACNRYQTFPKRCGPIQHLKLDEKPRKSPQTVYQNVKQSHRYGIPKKTTAKRYSRDKCTNYYSPIRIDKARSQMRHSNQMKRQNFRHEIPQTMLQITHSTKMNRFRAIHQNRTPTKTRKMPKNTHPDFPCNHYQTSSKRCGRM